MQNKNIIYLLVGVVLIAAVVGGVLLFQQSTAKTVTVTEAQGTNVSGILKFLSFL